MADKKGDPSAGQKSECIKVVVRCRPVGAHERSAGVTTIVEADRKTSTIKVNKPKEAGATEGEAPRTFTFGTLSFLVLPRKSKTA